MTRQNEEWWEWKTIDQNWTKHPEAYCKAKKGVLTKKLIKVHGCRKKKCIHFDDKVKFDGN